MPVTPTKKNDYLYTTTRYPPSAVPGLINPPRIMPGGKVDVMPGIMPDHRPAPPTPTAQPPGLLNNIPMPTPPAPYTTTPATPKEATSVGYTPEGFTVDRNATVAGNMYDLIDKDSPIMQQAKTRAAQAANARGLLSSSMAVGAGQAAVLDAALPIAQQDASTYGAAHTNTQNAKNAALNFDAAGKNQASQANAQLGTSVSLANAEAANKALQDSFQVNANYGLASLDVNTKMALANLDTQTKLALTQMENDNRQALQANQDASSMFNQVATAIGNISANPNLGQQAKDDAIATQMGLLQEGLRQQGDIAGLNLGGYFDYSITSGPQKASSPEQLTNNRRNLQLTIDRAKAALPVWGQNPQEYTAPPGSHQSERTEGNFNTLYQAKKKVLDEAERALREYNALNK